jgi:hypothetical protein
MPDETWSCVRRGAGACTEPAGTTVRDAAWAVAATIAAWLEPPASGAG